MALPPNIIFLFLGFLNGIDNSGPTCGLNEQGLWGGNFWVFPPPTVKYEILDKRPSIGTTKMTILTQLSGARSMILNIK